MEKTVFWIIYFGAGWWRCSRCPGAWRTCGGWCSTVHSGTLQQKLLGMALTLHTHTHTKIASFIFSAVLW